LAPGVLIAHRFGALALGRNGNVLHKRRQRREWCRAAGKWESLGGKFEGVLTASLLPDGNVLLIVIGQIAQFIR